MFYSFNYGDFLTHSKMSVYIVHLRILQFIEVLLLDELWCVENCPNQLTLG